MEAASSSTCVVMKEERIDGEDEEASGKKENCQGEGQEIAKKSGKEDGKKDGKEADHESGSEEKNWRGACSVQTHGCEKGRAR
jgi:hypothetical protein